MPKVRDILLILKKFFVGLNFNKRNQKVLSQKYDDPFITDYVARKTLEARNQTTNLDFNVQNYRYFIPFVFLSAEREISVLDFGGGAGYHFDSIENFLPHKISNWTVVETKSMVESARRIQVDRRLTFETSVGSLRDKAFDLVIASSSIQYCDSPQKILEQLLEIEARYYFITRMPIWERSTISVVQKSPLSSNGPGRQLYDLADGMVEYQLTVLNRTTFEDYFKDKYKIVFRSLESGDVHNVDGQRISQYGYLFQRKEEN